MCTVSSAFANDFVVSCHWSTELWVYTYQVVCEFTWCMKKVLIFYCFSQNDEYYVSIFQGVLVTAVPLYNLHAVMNNFSRCALLSSMTQTHQSLSTLLVQRSLFVLWSLKVTIIVNAVPKHLLMNYLQIESVMLYICNALYCILFNFVEDILILLI